MTDEALPPIPREVLDKMDPEVVNHALSTGAFLEQMIGKDAAKDLLTDVMAVIATQSKGVARRLWLSRDQNECVLILASGVDPTAENMAEILRKLDLKAQERKSAGDLN